MDDQIKKTVMLRARIRNVDRDLLETLCARHGWNLSEGVRQAIRNEAEREGLYNVGPFVMSEKQEAHNG